MTEQTRILVLGENVQGAELLERNLSDKGLVFIAVRAGSAADFEKQLRSARDAVSGRLGRRVIGDSLNARPRYHNSLFGTLLVLNLISRLPSWKETTRY